MFGINITKFNEFSKHWHGRVYSIYNQAAMKKLLEEKISINDYIDNGIAESQERWITDFKSVNVETTVKTLTKSIKKQFGQNIFIWFVCYNGRFSKTLTSLAQNVK